MWRPSLGLLVCISCLVCLVACGSALSSAKNDFRGGHVAEAKDKLIALEPESRSWTGSRKAEYVLYRGLVHHALGDRETALVWLKQARAMEDARPGTLSDDDKTRLDLALDAADLPTDSMIR